MKDIWALRAEMDASATIEQALLRDGWNSYGVGLRVDQCPRFKIEDMCVWWRTGWYRAARVDAEIRDRQEME